MLQCADGSLVRTVPLPAMVKGSRHVPSYRNGVLKVELPKLAPGRPNATQITVN